MEHSYRRPKAGAEQEGHGQGEKAARALESWARCSRDEVEQAEPGEVGGEGQEAQEEGAPGESAHGEKEREGQEVPHDHTKGWEVVRGERAWEHHPELAVQEGA